MANTLLNPIAAASAPLGTFSKGVLEDTTDLFGLRPQPASEILMKPQPLSRESTNPFNRPEMSAFAGVTSTLTPGQAEYWRSSAYATGSDLSDPLFREKEMAALRTGIKEGTAGANNLAGRLIAGSDAVTYAQNNSNNPLTRLTQEQELQARVDAYISVIKAETLDKDARDELFEMYRSGARAVDISSTLKDAQEKKGKYGARAAAVAEQEVLSRSSTLRQGIL